MTNIFGWTKMINVRDVLDELKFKLKIKTDAHLAEYLGVSQHALTKWISRDELPSKWQIKIEKIQKGENGITFVGNNNGHLNINHINCQDELKEIMELLVKYASPAYLQNIKETLLKMKNLSAGEE